MTWTEFAIRLVVAFLLGSALGLERQWRQRMAGLRTNTLVATGAALFVMLSVLTPGDSSPTRIAAQVVSGIGFLGGGVILREGLTVRGLNTAATLWCAAAIGSLSGAGLLLQAATGTVAVLVANLILRPLGYRINQQPLKGTELELCYRCDVVCRTQDEAHVRALLLQTVSGGKLQLRSLYSEDLEDTPDRVSVEAELVTQERNDALLGLCCTGIPEALRSKEIAIRSLIEKAMCRKVFVQIMQQSPLLEQIVSRLSLEPGVIAIRWRIIEQEFG